MSASSTATRCGGAAGRLRGLQPRSRGGRPQPRTRRPDHLLRPARGSRRRPGAGLRRPRDGHRRGALSARLRCRAAPPGCATPPSTRCARCRCARCSTGSTSCGGAGATGAWPSAAAASASRTRTMPPSPRRFSGPMAERVCVGAVAGAFGVRGEVRLKSFTAEPEAIADYAPAVHRGRAASFDLTLLRPVKGGFAARLSGVTTQGGGRRAARHPPLRPARPAARPARRRVLPRRPDRARGARHRRRAAGPRCRRC